MTIYNTLNEALAALDAIVLDDAEAGVKFEAHQ